MRLFHGVAFLLALGLAAFARAQPDGSPRWAGPFTTGGYIVSSPAVGADGTLYFGAQDKYFYAIAPTGALKWRFLAGDWVDSSPAIAPDGTIYFGCWDGKLYALRDHGTAAVKQWEYSTGVGNYIYSSPALGADGTIYFGAGDGNFYALRPDGTLKWTYPAGDWIDSSPAIGKNGLIYYGSWDGLVYAVRDDGATATEVWRFATNGPVLSSPALGRDGTVYIGANDGRLYALDGATGAKRWDFLAEGTFDTSAAVGPDGAIYFGGAAGYLHALNPDGSVRWKFGVADPIASTPAVRADGTVIFGAGDAAIYALDPLGRQKWKVGTGDWVDSSPVVAADGTIFLGSYDKKLYALNGSGSPASGFSDWPMFRRDPRRTGYAQPLAPGGRLENLSTRARGGAGVNLIPGFVVSGSAAANKPFLVRAVGPSLPALGTPLPDPRFELFARINDANVSWGTNDDWWRAPNADKIVAAAQKTGAFPLLPGGPDAALLLELAPRSYTAPVNGAGAASGLALVEIYDVEPENPAARLINLSTRGHSGTGADVLIAGLVTGGSGPVRLLLRAVGPTLASLFQVPNTLARPTLTLYAGNAPLVTSAGWSATGRAADLRAAAAAVGAFALDEGSADSAMIVTLPPGHYTLHVAGLDDTTGEALAEVYLLP